MNPKKLLRDYNLSLTAQRIKLLTILHDSGHALTEKEIEVQMKGNCNKTTIYRNLASLVDKKILHRIISDVAVKYKLIEVSAAQNRDHLHFQCKKCSTTFCMYGIPVQEYTLPEGFKILENQFLVLGICKDCRYEIE
jgi:Fur family transcriptional regulator, ferric uptake regulator